MMKLLRKTSKILSILLAVVMAFAVVGCGGNETGGEEKPSNAKDGRENFVNFGTHDYTYEVLEDNWFIKNGTTEYKVVYPAETQEADKKYYHTYRNEFLNFYNEATGGTILAYKDSELPTEEKTHKSTQKFISIGNTSLFKSLKEMDNLDPEIRAQLDVTMSTLGRAGGRIITVDNNVYIIGATDRGTMCTVYTYLNLTFGFKAYTPQTIALERNVKNKELYKYSVIDIPDTDNRNPNLYMGDLWRFGPDYSYAFPRQTENEELFGYRNRTFDSNVDGLTEREIYVDYYNLLEDPNDVHDVWNNHKSDVLGNLNQPGGHNSVLLVSPTRYNDPNKENYHPAWFGTTNGIQLCYTCGGDKEEYEMLTTALAQTIEIALIEKPRDQYPYANQYEITHSDSMTMCGCDECEIQRAVIKDSGMFIKFFNDVAEKVEDWMNLPENEPYKRDDLAILFYAYFASAEPPVVLNEEGEWEAVNDEVMMHKNTIVKYAFITCDFQQSLMADFNLWAKDNFDGWGAVANGQIGYFHYNENANNSLYFYDGFDHFNTEGYNYYFTRGRAYNYAETNPQTIEPTTFIALKSFIDASMAYNCIQDTGVLIKEFFDNVYGPASGTMFKLFEMIRIFNHNQTTKYNLYKSNSIFNKVDTVFEYSLPLLQGWIELADQAIAELEVLKETDIEKYDQIVYLIESEVVPIIVILYKHNIIMPQEFKDSLEARIYDNMAKYPGYRYIYASGTSRMADFVAQYNI